MKKPFALFPLVALLAAACTDAPTAPPAVAETEAAATVAFSGGMSLNVSTSSSSLSDFDGDLNVIVNRILPNFANESAAATLRGHIAEIQTAIDVGNRTEVARLTDVAEADLVPGVTNGGDRGYIQLVLRRINTAAAR